MICPNQLFPYNRLHLLPWLLPYLKTLKLSTRVCVHTHTDALGTKINNGEKFLLIPLIFPIKFSLLQAFLVSESWNNCTSAATWSVSVALLKIALYEQQKTSRKKKFKGQISIFISHCVGHCSSRLTLGALGFVGAPPIVHHAWPFLRKSRRCIYRHF